VIGHALRIVSREEVGQSLQGRVRFLLGVRLQDGNRSECSSGALSGRWLGLGLGIFAVAQLGNCRISTNMCCLILFAGCPEEVRLQR
jgi:hypothetical protein